VIAPARFALEKSAAPVMVAHNDRRCVQRVTQGELQ
jgi:hypothetical protein